MKNSSSNNLPSPNENTSQNTFNQIMKIFILPEIECRQEKGLIPTPFELHSAQIVFFPDERKRIIRLNEEVEAYVTVSFKPGIEKKKGETIFSNEIERIEEIELTEKDDPDCAHVLLIEIKNNWYLLFDFRYNKQLAQKYMIRATEFIENAKFDLTKKYWGAFVDNLFSASELLATSILLIMPNPKMRKKTNHHMIKNGFNRYIQNGNLNTKYSDIFNKLSELRHKGRYVSGKFILSEVEANQYLSKMMELKEEISVRFK